MKKTREEEEAGGDVEIGEIAILEVEMETNEEDVAIMDEWAMDDITVLTLAGCCATVCL